MGASDHPADSLLEEDSEHDDGHHDGAAPDPGHVEAGRGRGGQGSRPGRDDKQKLL